MFFCRWLPWRCFRFSSIQALCPETPPLSNLPSKFQITLTMISISVSLSVVCLNDDAVCICRYDLDACDIQEKYPDLFQVQVNVEVEPQDRPSNKTTPWENFATKGLNPKILFSSRDEQQEILTKFGEFSLYFVSFFPWFFRALIRFYKSYLWSLRLKTS